LIPVVRFTRAVRDCGRSGVRLSLLVRMLPTLAVGLALDGVGQMLGYAVGADETLRTDLVCFESHRSDRNADDARRARASTA
jgi:hypothetical protein